MKQLVLYYSYSGHTKGIAEKLAQSEGADLYEVKDAKRPGKLKAYTAGCIAAINGKSWPCMPISPNLAQYRQITIMAPVWAGNPAPVINNAFALLPAGKDVKVLLVAASGNGGNVDNLRALVEGRGCKLVACETLKG